MFELEELKNLIVFLNRCNLQGNESMVHAMMLQKITVMIKEMEAGEKEIKAEENKDKNSKGKMLETVQPKNKEKR